MARRRRDKPSRYPLISERKNGDRVVGYRGKFAEVLYSEGTPPMHGLAAQAPVADRVRDIRIGDQLLVEREDGHWVVADSQGILGRTRWKATDNGRTHAVTGATVRFPDRGVLHVERLVLSQDGTVKDIGGYVTPEE